MIPNIVDPSQIWAQNPNVRLKMGKINLAKKKLNKVYWTRGVFWIADTKNWIKFLSDSNAAWRTIFLSL